MRREGKLGWLKKKMKPGKEGREVTLMDIKGMFGFQPKDNGNY